MHVKVLCVGGIRKLRLYCRSYLNKRKLREMFLAISGNTLSTKQIDVLFQLMDKEQNEQISFAECVVALCTVQVCHFSLLLFLIKLIR